jgi:hypothetical protein
VRNKVITCDNTIPIISFNGNHKNSDRLAGLNLLDIGKIYWKQLLEATNPVLIGNPLNLQLPFKMEAKLKSMLLLCPLACHVTSLTLPLFLSKHALAITVGKLLGA